MPQRDQSTVILGLQGWEIMNDGISIEEDGGMVISITPVAGGGYRCSRCGEGVLIAYDHMESRRIRDFPWAGRRCELEVVLARVDCPCCKAVAVERLDWLEPAARQTLRYERYVAALCSLMPATDVAFHEGLDKSTVYRIDKKWLERREALRPDQPVERLGIDEIAIRKGHKYATVFYDLDRREVIGMVPHRRERGVSRFFRRWGKENCKRVKAVCMDLWAPFLNSVRRHLKNADVVFDKFHVYHYLSDAIEAVRRNEQLLANAQGSELIKGTRWLWLKARKSLSRQQKTTLAEIMKVNRRLCRAYILKEDFEAFYASCSAEDAAQFLKGWTKRCMQSNLLPFIALAKRLTRWSAGILMYFTHRITNGISEGINNLIKVIKRRSYGFHDFDYFCLKILDATGTLPPLSTVTTHSYAE
jgi:transposase